MPKRKKRRKHSNKIQGLAHQILTILRKNNTTPYNYKQIAAKLGVDDPSSRNQIVKKLKALQINGEIKEIERGKYILTPSKNYHTGIMDITSRGRGFVIVEGIDEDIKISNKNLNKALNGDTVEVYVFKRKRGGRMEGEVTKIIERKRTEFVGTIQISDKFSFVECQGYNMYTDIFVPKSKIGGAENGDKGIGKNGRLGSTFRISSRKCYKSTWKTRRTQYRNSFDFSTVWPTV